MRRGFRAFFVARRAVCLGLVLALMLGCLPAVLATEQSLSGVFPDDDILTPGTPMPVSYDAKVDGTLEILVRMQSGEFSAQLPSVQVKAGRGAITWDGMIEGVPVQPGEWVIQLTLVEANGARSLPNAAGVQVVAGDQPAGQPAAQTSAETDLTQTAESGDDVGTATESQAPEEPSEPVVREPGEDRQLSEFPDPHELCAWGLDIDSLDINNPDDQAKIWEVLMQPVIVLDVGPKEHVYPLISPDADPKDPENLTGQVHGTTAGVHVLEQLDNGWSLIETFSTDGYGSPDDDKFHELDNRLIHGYVRTKLLKTVKPYSKFGLVIDKYTQRMYIFKEGKLFTTLLVSTGFPTESQPWNETPSGEYLVDTWVGKFANDDLMCDLALRINGGCLIHEVPHKELADGTRNYAPFEPYLGKKASHGCVRVQRMRNNDGINMTWLWNNLKRNTHVLIWDDEGRASIPVPPDAMTMYYNPDGGKSYHRDQNCSAVKARFLPLTELPYEALYEEPTNKLIPCYGCVPFFRVPDPADAIPDDIMGTGTWDE